MSQKKENKPEPKPPENTREMLRQKVHAEKTKLQNLKQYQPKKVAIKR